MKIANNHGSQTLTRAKAGLMCLR